MCGVEGLVLVPGDGGEDVWGGGGGEEGGGCHFKPANPLIRF